MKRARAAQLALVNWRGVFYERYELSDAVTALEGANGAGKTTVLIAAFVVLLPGDPIGLDDIETGPPFVPHPGWCGAVERES